MQGHVRIHRHDNFVIHAPGIRVGSLHKVRNHRYPVPTLALINLNFAGVGSRGNTHVLTDPRFHRDWAVQVNNGNVGSPANFEMHFLTSSLRCGKSSHDNDHHDRYSCDALLPVHNRHLPNASSTSLVPRHGYSTTVKTDRGPSRRP